LDTLPYNNAVCYVLSKTCTQSVTCEDNRIIWDISGDFTDNSGTFDIQLKISDGDKSWLSDVMLLIVSESVSASTNTTVSSTSGKGCHLVYEDISLCLDLYKNKTFADKVFKGGIIFNYEGD
jgi:hypothetical protein